ncbi:MAG: ATP-NAD kinase family protein [Planctomycetes bacterium]|nr:ATP-NAD kinase family protein [Planctomycetota bacterium]
MKKLGLIINPIAGMGGPVGLKGTDGADILAQAQKLGAKPRAQQRTIEALKQLTPLKDPFKLLTCPQSMGQDATTQCAFAPELISLPIADITTANDTQIAAKTLRDAEVDLLLFVGGDGTARDIFTAVGDTIVTLGIPAGVKIHSGVYASNPTDAGRLAASFLSGQTHTTVEAEVMDIDEESVRNDMISAQLFGYLKIPFERKYLQCVKAASSATENHDQQAIAFDVVDNMIDDCCYIIGPGSTTRAIMQELKLPYTLLGVDLVYNRQLIGKDLSETELLQKIQNLPTKLIITPIGGQGYILGRGNQQISPAVIAHVGKENIHIIATAQKIRSLYGRPLRVDTGCEKTNQLLTDYYIITTSYRESIVYKVKV